MRDCFASYTEHDRCENGDSAQAQENHQNTAHDIPAAARMTVTSMSRKRRFEELT